MNTRILKLASRNVFEDISIDLCIHESFEETKELHENDYKGLTFRQVKKNTIVNLFSCKKNIERYLNDCISDYECELKENYLGETYLKETKQLIEFLKSYLKTI